MAKEQGQEIEKISSDSTDLRQKVKELEERIVSLEKKGDQLSLVHSEI